jgi:choline dehydrogenase-like flavoprotein
VGGLRVVDASIFPVVPCANTNLPVLMTGKNAPTRSWAGTDRRYNRWLSDGEGLLSRKTVP